MGCCTMGGVVDDIVVGCVCGGGKDIVGVETEFCVKCGYMGGAKGLRVDGIYCSCRLGGSNVELGIRVWLGFWLKPKVCG